MLVELTFSGKRGLEAGEALVAELGRSLQQLRSWSEVGDSRGIPFDESCGVVIDIDTSVIRVALDTGRSSVGGQVTSPRGDQIRHIESRCAELNAEIAELSDLRECLKLEQAREDHPCSCVAYNADLLIYDMIEQEAQGRVGIGIGPVHNTLSARRDCPRCHGTGKPSV